MTDNQILEVAFVSSLVTEHLFEEIYPKFENDTITARTKVAMFAIEFEKHNRLVYEFWDGSEEAKTFGTYEEFVIDTAKKHFEL